MFDRSSKVVVVMAVLALLLMAAVPVSLFAGLILMLFGHVIGGLALFGGNILALGAVLAVGGITAVRQVRRIISTQSVRIMRLGGDDYSSYLR